MNYANNIEQYLEECGWKIYNINIWKYYKEDRDLRILFVREIEVALSNHFKLYPGSK